MKRLVAIAILMLAACEPSPEEPSLDGAPELDGAPATAPETPVDLGGASSAVNAGHPGLLGIVPPTGVQVIDSCETVIAADYDRPPKMACLLFQTEDSVKGQLDAGVFASISEAGWSQVRAQGDQYYFERPRPGTDCAEVAVLSVVTDRLQAVLEHAGANAPAGSTVWQAYAIPASTLEACGADRMKP